MELSPMSFGGPFYLCGSETPQTSTSGTLSSAVLCKAGQVEQLRAGGGLGKLSTGPQAEVWGQEGFHGFRWLPKVQSSCTAQENSGNDVLENG